MVWTPTDSPAFAASRRLQPQDLMGLEAYARERAAFRSRVIAHKQARRIAVGPNTTWCFEDRLTVQYQIQEMLRTERIFEADGIQAELDAYNPLIPEGNNLKVTLLLEYPDAGLRAEALRLLRGIETACWVEVAGRRSFAIADEDLARDSGEKTAAVHFLRFELGPSAREAFAAGPVVIGIDHPAYTHATALAPASRAALAVDLDP
jgi:hypothetical protein